MKVPFVQSYWLRRLLASDPGRKRLNQAGKATVSLISSVFTTMMILNLLDQQTLLPSIISGIAGLMGIMIVMDETKEKKQVTTGLLALSAGIGVTLGSLLAWNAFLVSTLMIVIIFSSFYFSRFGSRYFSLGMIGFFTVYFSSFLQLSPAQFPWFYVAIVIGVSYAFLYNFILFKDSVQMLKRSMQSFHRQANLTFQLLIEIIEDPEIKESRKKKLDYNIGKLRKYASNVATELNAQDIRKLWPGLKPNQLRLYVFDAAMFIMTLSDSLQKLKKDDALETVELRTILIEVISTLKNADVLDEAHQEQNLLEAEKVVHSLRQTIDDLFEQSMDQPEGWLYLLRRIEAIATHVTKGAIDVQYYIRDLSAFDTIEEEPAEEEEEEEEEGMKPTTKKAIQSLIAGTIAIIVGYLISPIQPYWVLLTTFIVQLGTETVGRTYLKGLERSIGTVIGAGIGFILAKLVSGHSELEVVLLFTVIFLAFYLLSVSYTLMTMFITMLIAFMYDLILGGISYELLEARVVDTIAGAAIALGVSALIYPTRTMDKVSEVFIDYLVDLDAYVTEYVKSFQKMASVKGLADLAFDMDEKIQTIEDESKPILQGPGGRKYSGLPRLITLFTAINYYAKHLVASSYQKNFQYPDEVGLLFQSMEEKLSHNIQVLKALIETKEISGSFYNLQSEREEIERRAPGHQENQGDLVHHLYYIWKINQALLLIGEELGLDEKNKES
ncbi:FUSC family protein [Halobacillus litoralis]|uniref:Integral membrane bound transporter domain-containing protein n=1 Tax=Halobacillus litoralis TaxID=45668 RepID=A0A410M8P1_9BACI|nr:FUSC family protein [Halobacillus litoralis]QAS51066.1 hypothetical protein HLI_02040 [Halobacillus litoralis]